MKDYKKQSGVSNAKRGESRINLVNSGFKKNLVQGRLGGAVTVFFALVFALICALLLSVAESVRTQAARLYLTQAVNSSIDSLFSQYHIGLWEQYRLLGLEHYSDFQLEEEMKGFLAPYLQADDFYPMRLSAVRLQTKERITDRDGAVFEEEALAYMKYGIVSSVMDSALAELFLTRSREAGALDEVAGLYASHSREAVRLEKTLERLNDCLLEQEEGIADAKEGAARHRLSAVRSGIRKADKALSRLPDRIDAYEKAADALRAALAESRSQFEEKRAEGCFSEDVLTGLEADLSAYESYVDKDGERRLEITGFRMKAEALRAELAQILEMAEDVQARIDAWDDEENEPDPDAMWRPVVRALDACAILRMQGAHGVADKETEEFLEQVGALLEGCVLSLLLPDGGEPSEQALPLADAPSGTLFAGNDHCRLNLLDRLFVTEYLSKTMHYYGRDRYGEKPERKGTGGCEQEYILEGKESDWDNLAAVAYKLIALRTGMNLIYLYKDSAKRAQARALAGLLTGVLGFTPLIAVMTFFVLSVWALGQALCDVRDLFHGNKVPLLHTGQTFYLDLDGLFQIGKSGSLAPRQTSGDAENGSGLSYQTYLKLFLMASQGILQDYRSMDVIQMTVRQEQSDFLIERCAFSATLEAQTEAQHLFGRLGLSGSQGRFDGSYEMRVAASYSY